MNSYAGTINIPYNISSVLGFTPNGTYLRVFDVHIGSDEFKFPL